MKKGLLIAAIIAGGVGIAATGIGMLFRLMHWPGGSEMLLMGQGLIVIGAVVFLISLLAKKKP